MQILRKTNVCRLSTGIRNKTHAADGLAKSLTLWNTTRDTALASECDHRNRRMNKNEVHSEQDEEVKHSLLLLTRAEHRTCSGQDQEIVSFQLFDRNEFDIGKLDRDEFSVLGTKVLQTRD